MRRALFLDRDGIINIERDFVFRRNDFEFLPGIFDLARSAVDSGLLPVVVTNQSGIARGYYTNDAFLELTKWMCDVFESHGAPIAKVYHCPYHPHYPNPEFDQFRGWRKPLPGMFFQARDEMNIDLSRSLMIGDRWSDAEAAIAAGVADILIVNGLHRLPLNTGNTVDTLSTLVDARAWLEQKIIDNV